MIRWNEHVKLVLADVDETVADVYTDATDSMIQQLNFLLSKDIILFLISGGGLQSIRERIVNKINPLLRKNVLIAHCMGAEVWGFLDNGEIMSKPYYGVYDSQFSESQKKKWREVISLVVETFKLKTTNTMPASKFISETKGDPLSVMLADRGPQITFEFVNSVDMTEEEKLKLENFLGIKIEMHEGTYDLRVPIVEHLRDLYKKENLPVTPKLSGTFALDNTISGVDKTMAIRYVLENKKLLEKLGLPDDIEIRSEFIEIWGDKYSQKKGGPDLYMCKAVDPNVRAIDFREENPDDLSPDYNIQIWKGKKYLHEGLLEYLMTAV